MRLRCIAGSGTAAEAAHDEPVDQEDVALESWRSLDAAAERLRRDAGIPLFGSLAAWAATEWPAYPWALHSPQ